MGILQKAFGRKNRVTVRKVAGGALILQNAGNVFFMKPQSYSKIAVSKKESGEVALLGSNYQGSPEELAIFSNESAAIKALDKIYATSSSSWRSFAKKIIFVAVALFVIDGLVGAFKIGQSPSVVSQQESHSSVNMSGEQTAQLSQLAPSNDSAPSSDAQSSSSSFLNCPPPQ